MEAKTITANIPARTIKLSTGTRKVPGRTETLKMDESGKWSIAFAGTMESITEAEALDVLRKASNWDEIRREHFPMHGFHS